MNKIVVLWFSLVAKIANEYWWPAWSNFRWRNSIRSNIEVTENDKIRSIPDVRRTACKIYSKFTWTSDGVDELMDSVTPPPQNYQNYVDGALNDDCDGFHSAMYHFMYNSGVECYLLSVNAMSLGHCVLLFKLNNLWYVNDYTTVTEGHTTAQAAITAYNYLFEKEYQATSAVFYNGLTKYDYIDGKFKNQPIADIKD